MEIIEATYEHPHSEWTVSKIYDKVVSSLQKVYNIRSVNTSGTSTTGPCNPNAPAFLTLTNVKTGKYIVVSYWDRAHETLYESCGWNPKLCQGIYTSHGVFNEAVNLSDKFDVPIIPISFCQYRQNFDTLAKKSVPNNMKANKNLLFRGWLHRCGLRDELGVFLPDIVKDQGHKIFFDDYYQELQDYKIGLSLDGAAELSHRDIEILGARSVLLRAKLNQKFYNPLVENVHYISFERAANGKDQANIILQKYNEIKDNEELLTNISENGYKWYLENGTVEKNAEIIINQLDMKSIL